MLSLLQNLLHYYTCDSTPNDSIGGVDLTNEGSTTFSAGILGNGADFVTASSQRLRTTTSHAAGMKTQLSSSAWYYRSSGSHLIMAGPGQSGWYAFQPLWYSDGQVYWFGGDGGYGYCNVGATGRHHVVMVYDGTLTGDANRLKGYIDGVQQTLGFGASPGASIDVASGEINLGYSYSYGYATGQIDEYGIWARALSAGDVTRLYNGGLALPVTSFGQSGPLIGGGLVR